MSNIINFVTTNPIQCFSGIVIAVAIVLLIYYNRKDVLIKSALYIVAKVEEEWGSDMGKIKFAEAYTYLKHTYPLITFLLPERTLSGIIEDALIRLKEILKSKEAKKSQ